MTPWLPRLRAALVVAPHPDDEVIGAFGLMRALIAARVRVHVLVVTDGAASHPRSRLWPPARLAARRLQESRWALRRIGLSADRIRSLALPDGRLAQIQPLVDRRVARAVRCVAELDLLVGPMDDDDHADHRAVAAALARIRTPALRLTYAVWPADAEARQRVQLPVRGGAMAKRAALRTYRSQLGDIRDDPQGFALSARQVAAFTRGRERFGRSGP